MKIPFSKKFMEVFGNTVYDAKNQIFVKQLKPTSWYIDLFNYMIDWKTRKKVHLVNWLANQLKDSRPILNEIVVDNNLNDSSYDVAILNILKWVKSNYNYHGDLETYNAKEYWATFNESYYLPGKWGDCEDGAIAVLLLARAAGIPENKIKLVCGNVKTSSGIGGHAYVLYTANDGMQYPIDWCYWPKLYGFSTRKSVWEEPNYLLGREIWFGVNDVQGYK